MKRLNQLLLMILLVIAGSNAAYADVVENYTMNFDSPIVTTEPNFKAAPGWAHVASKYHGTAKTCIPHIHTPQRKAATERER